MKEGDNFYVIYNDVRICIGITTTEETAKNMSERIGGFYEIVPFYI